MQHEPRKASPGPPFSVGLLASRDNAGYDIDLLPAITRFRDELLVVPGSRSEELRHFLARDLSVDRLNCISDLLWLVGWPMPPRPLHHQEVLMRAITPSQQMDLHLVWCKGRIFVKPMPIYLMDRQFWSDNLNDSNDREARSARGFLRSYCALIMTECDFRIACQHGLLPEGITWPAWKTWSREIITNCDEQSCSPRWWYGELRLSRLNAIYRFHLGHIVRGYSRVAAPSGYQSFFEANINTLAASTAYIAVVLTAMQVGLGTDLQHSRAFTNASYGFTVFAIISPPIVLGLIFGVFLLVFVANWTATKRQRKKRFVSLGIDTGRKRSSKLDSSAMRDSNQVRLDIKSHHGSRS